ncbi:FAD:protein FMN transferase [Spirochaetia bacterium]|nr:FAD:protein FMN transferase [Spirochaetia bacterium]
MGYKVSSTNRLWFLLILIAVLGGCRPLGHIPAQSELVLGTLCTVNLYRGGTTRLYRQIFARLREIEASMSVNRADTEADRINQNAGIAPVRVSPELMEVLERARYYAEASGGVFDPTVGPLVKLWGIGTDTPRLPEEAEIRAALGLVNWRELVLDPAAGTAFLSRTGMALDLGAIAKGYAADEAVRLIEEAGLPGAVIDLGGNIFAYGTRERGKLRFSLKEGFRFPKNTWRLGIQNPQALRGDYVGVLELINKTLVTSGIYERNFEAQGRQYHHILSTKTGYPVENGLLSVTIIGDRSVDADALSTAAFALGFEKGRALIETAGAEGLFIFRDRSIRGTAKALELFTLTDQSYRIME